MSNKEKNQQDQETDISNFYFILKETNILDTYDAELIEQYELDNHKGDDFKKLSDWALKNNKKVYIVNAYKVLITIIPEVNVVNNYI